MKKGGGGGKLEFSIYTIASVFAEFGSESELAEIYCKRKINRKTLKSGSMLISWIFLFLISQGMGAKLPIPSVLSSADWPIGEDENRKNDLADSKTMKEVLETYIGNVMVAEILKYLSEEIDKVGNADIYKKVVQIASSINASNKEKSLMVEDSSQISTPNSNYWFETSLAEGMTVGSTSKNSNTSKSLKGMKFLHI